MTTIIKGQPTSAEIRKQLKEMNMPVILQFSCGKDSIATWIALADEGIEVFPCYLHLVPGLQFIREEIDYFQEVFDTKINEYIHPGLYRQIGKSMVAQPPERIGVISGWHYSDQTYDQFWDSVRKFEGLPEDCYLADGIRACDSPVRRTSFVQHGIMKKAHKKVSPIADWTDTEVKTCITERGIELPIDYKLFGRSFDGCDYRFIKPLKEHLPEDYERVLELFPLADADIFRREELEVPNG